MMEDEAIPFRKLLRFFSFDYSSVKDLKRFSKSVSIWRRDFCLIKYPIDTKGYLPSHSQ